MAPVMRATPDTARSVSIRVPQTSTVRVVELNAAFSVSRSTGDSKDPQ